MRLWKSLLRRKKEQGVPPSRGADGWPPLHLAAFRGQRDVAEALVSNNAEVNARDETGETPLHWAASKGHRDVAEFLLANGADAFATDGGGWTPLHTAAANGNKEVTQLLLDSQAKADTKDHKGRTALELAAANGYKDVVELLSSCGTAEPSTQNNHAEKRSCLTCGGGEVKAIQDAITQGECPNCGPVGFEFGSEGRVPSKSYSVKRFLEREEQVKLSFFRTVKNGQLVEAKAILKRNPGLALSVSDESFARRCDEPRCEGWN